MVLKADRSKQKIKKLEDKINKLKGLEEELRSSQERLKMIFEFAPDAYYLCNLKGVFVDGNRAAEGMSGYKRKELIGKSFLKLKLLPPNQIIKAAKLLAKNALKQPTGPDEFTFTRKNREKVSLEISTHPVTMNGESLILGLARDMTPRKRIEEELRNKNTELVKFNKFAVKRELRMVELKKRVRQLEEQLYKSR